LASTIVDLVFRVGTNAKPKCEIDPRASVDEESPDMIGATSEPSREKPDQSAAHATRAAIASSAADMLSAVSHAGFSPGLIGFDGFIDYILRMVDVRSGISPAEFTPIRTIAEFAARCAAAAGKSTNIEQVLIEERFGGNGPLMAGALAQLGVPVTFIGAVATSDAGPALHPTFMSFAQRCREVIAVGEPSFTDALEFDDGKLMFNNTRAVQVITWERIVERVGLDRLVQIVDASTLLGVVNWSLLGGVPGIWRGLMRDVLPRCTPRDRIMFVDLSDPAKRTDADVLAVTQLLAELERAGLGLRVCLGLNLAESERLGRVLGLTTSTWRAGPILCEAATALRERIGISRVTIHPREGGAAADAHHAAWIDGPLVQRPRISTGAGDHYNAGFSLALACGASLEQCLACAVAVSGAYVRDGESPTLERLLAFLRALPEPNAA
jgi:sugar/nucleoside kinase (ribokinase family)